MEERPMTPGQARVIRRIHPLNGGNERGMSLTRSIDNRDGTFSPPLPMKGPTLKVAPLPINAGFVDASKVIRKHT
eukprot:641086-Pyramimonas_sp.AAC.1